MPDNQNKSTGLPEEKYQITRIKVPGYQKKVPDNRGVDESYGEGECNPAGDGKQHQHLPSLESEQQQNMNE